jgi:hypothetical protein
MFNHPLNPFHLDHGAVRSQPHGHEILGELHNANRRAAQIEFKGEKGFVSLSALLLCSLRSLWLIRIRVNPLARRSLWRSLGVHSAVAPFRGAMADRPWLNHLQKFFFADDFYAELVGLVEF